MPAPWSMLLWVGSMMASSLPSPYGHPLLVATIRCHRYFPQMPRDLARGFKAQWGMDLTMTYELTSDIPMTFWSDIFLNATVPDLFAPPRVPIDRCVPGRGACNPSCSQEGLNARTMISATLILKIALRCFRKHWMQTRHLFSPEKTSAV